MRGLFYSILNVDTKEKTFVGLDSAKAQKVLEQMKKENPNANLMITFKWGHI